MIVSTVAAVILGAAATPAGAADLSLKIATPTAHTAVHDTLDITLTGQGLRTVAILAWALPVAQATVSPDGTTATAEIDTTYLPDGPLVLGAVARGANHRLAKAKPVVVTITNATADQRPAGYHRTVLRDEFRGHDLNRRLWCTRFPYEGGPELETPDPACLSPDGAAGRLDTLGLKRDAEGNQIPGQEEQVYREVNAEGRRMHTIQHGYLSLHATRTRPQDPFLGYESAMLRSKTEIEPVENHSLYLTARVRMPNVKGSWPAFWLAPGFTRTGTANWPPEIDVLEGALNVQDDKVNMIHINAINGGVPGGQTSDGHSQLTYAHPTLYDPQWQNYLAPQSIRDVWIEVGLEWTVDGMCWFVDGTKISCQNYTWQTNEGTVSNPATVMLNLAVGGPWAGRYGVDVGTTPTRYDIDHVRVYRS